MDRLPARALAAIRDSLDEIRTGSLEPAPANLAEIAWLAQACDLSDQRVVALWIGAAHVREHARRTRDRSAATRERARRLRARAGLRVLDGSSPAGQP